MKPFKILFLCSDNFTRSVTAEFCLKDFLKKNAINSIKVFSAGTNANSDISKMYSTHFETMGKLGVDHSDFKRTQITKELINDVDMVLGMGKEHLDFVEENFKISIPLFNEYVYGEKTSIVVSKPDSDENIHKQISDMVKYIYDSMPMLYKRISALYIPTHHHGNRDNH